MKTPGECRACALPPGLSPGCSASPERSLPERWQPVWRRGSGRARRRGGAAGFAAAGLAAGFFAAGFSQPAWRQVSPRAWRRSQRPAWLPASRQAWLRQASPRPWLPAWSPVSLRPSQSVWRRAWLPAWRPRFSPRFFRRGFRRRLGGGLGCRFSCRLGRCGFRRGLGSRFRRRLGRCLRRRLDADAGEFLDLLGQRIDLAVQLLHLVAARHAETRDGAVQALVESFLELAPLAERTVPNLVDLALRRAGGSLRRTDLRVHIGLRFFFSLLAVFHQGLEQLAAVLADLRVGPRPASQICREYFSISPIQLDSFRSSSCQPSCSPYWVLATRSSTALSSSSLAESASTSFREGMPIRFNVLATRLSNACSILSSWSSTFPFTEERPVLTLSLAEST